MRKPKLRTEGLSIGLGKVSSTRTISFGTPFVDLTSIASLRCWLQADVGLSLTTNSGLVLALLGAQRYFTAGPDSTIITSYSQRIAEVAIFDGILAGNDLTNAENFLISKFALT